MTINSIIGWHGIAASALCAFYSSYLAKKSPANSVMFITPQTGFLRIQKRFGSSRRYPSRQRRHRPSSQAAHSGSVAVFADGSKVNEYGQLLILASYLIGPLQNGSTIYTLSWMSHKVNGRVKSPAADEVLAIVEAMAKGKNIRDTLCPVLRMSIELKVVTDSKHLYNTLSLKREFCPHIYQADDNIAMYEYEIVAVSDIVWAPVSTDFPDHATQRYSPLCDKLKLIIQSRNIPFYFTRAESRFAERWSG